MDAVLRLRTWRLGVQSPPGAPTYEDSPLAGAMWGARIAALALASLMLGGMAEAGRSAPDGQRRAVTVVRPAPNITAGMSDLEVRTVLAFDSYVRQTAAELGWPRAPQVVYLHQGVRVPFKVGREKMAFVWPGYLLVALTPRAVGVPDWRLRCFARHELLHFQLGHTSGSLTEDEQDEKHRQVAAEQLARWREDSRCE